MRSLKWTQIQYALCPCKNRKPEHLLVQTEEDIKTQGEDDHPQAKEQGLGQSPLSWRLEENSPTVTFGLDF
jgi:hypothetical protein